MKKQHSCDTELAQAMTQVVLNDILNSVISEFEKKVGVHIGTIVVDARGRGQQKRKINIEVKKTGKNCIDGLAEYKKFYAATVCTRQVLFVHKYRPATPKLSSLKQLLTSGLLQQKLTGFSYCTTL